MSAAFALPPSWCREHQARRRGGGAALMTQQAQGIGRACEATSVPRKAAGVEEVMRSLNEGASRTGGQRGSFIRSGLDREPIYSAAASRVMPYRRCSSSSSRMTVIPNRPAKYRLARLFL